MGLSGGVSERGDMLSEEKTKKLGLALQKCHRRGMTLIEIMIVVAIMAGIMGLGLYNLGVIGAANVSGEALRVSASVRYVFNLAATSNKTLQMKIDFDNGTFVTDELDVSRGLSVEELGGETMRSVQDRDKFTNNRISAIDEEDQEFASLQRRSLEGAFASEEDTTLKEGVYFIGLMTSHHSEIQTEGVGTINFFSNGYVERSVIILGDENARNGDDQATIFSISINPLNGHSEVTAGRLELNEAFFEEEEDR